MIRFATGKRELVAPLVDANITSACLQAAIDAAIVDPTFLNCELRFLLLLHAYNRHLAESRTEQLPLRHGISS